MRASVAATRQGVVQVSTGGGSGSGFFVRLRGRPICITAFHVVDDAVVQLAPGRSRQVAAVVLRTADGVETPARIWRSSRDHDIALLIPVVLPEGIRVLEVDDRLPRKGSAVFAWGAPWGEALVPLDGLVQDVLTGKRRPVEATIQIDMIQVGISVAPGSSGGPLLNMSGRVIGVITRRSETNDGTGLGQGYAIAARVFWAQIQTFELPPGFGH